MILQEEVMIQGSSELGQYTLVLYCYCHVAAADEGLAIKVTLLPTSQSTTMQMCVTGCMQFGCTLAYLVTLSVHDLVILKELPPNVKEV